MRISDWSSDVCSSDLDDGQSTWSLDQADVVLVGVSRTSKTPTCVYLANRGLKAANIPYVPNVPLPRELFSVRRPLVVGLTLDPMRLVQIRRNRLLALNQEEIGRAHVCTPVTNAHLVCRLMLEKK